MKPRLLEILYVVFFAALMLLPRLGDRDLWTPDEPRYAQVAREMLSSGDYVVPRWGGEIYTSKPPGQSWMMIGTQKVFEFFGAPPEQSTLIVVLPSAIAGIGVALLTYLIGLLLLPRAAVLWGTFLLMTSSYWVWLGRFAQLDMPMTFFTTLATYLLLLHYRKEGPRWGFFFSAWIVMGLGSLVKGPPALICPVVTLGLFLIFKGWVQRKNPAVEVPDYRRRRRGEWLAWGLGFLVTVGVGMLWLWPCLVATQFETLKAYWREIGGQAVNSWSHPKPCYFFVVHFFPEFMPQALLLLVGLWIFGTDIRRALRTKETAFPWGGLFLLCWFGGIFLFFSCISAKRNLYMMPLLPAAALIGGEAMRHWVEEKNTWPFRFDQVLRWTIFLMGMLLLLAAVAIPFLPNLEKIRDLLPMSELFDRHSILLICCGLGMGGLLMLLAFFRKNRTLQGGTMIVGMALVMMETFDVVLPCINQQQSYRQACLETLQLLRPEGGTKDAYDFRIYRSEKFEALVYFLDRPIQRLPDMEALREFLAHDPMSLVIVRHDLDLANLVREKIPFKLVYREKTLLRKEKGKDRALRLVAPLSSPLEALPLQAEEQPAYWKNFDEE